MVDGKYERYSSTATVGLPYFVSEKSKQTTQRMEVGEVFRLLFKFDATEALPSGPLPIQFRLGAGKSPGQSKFQFISFEGLGLKTIK